MHEVRIANSLKEIKREDWNACFIGEIEDYDYLLAVECSGIMGFIWRYIIALEGDKIIAATPMFMSGYSLDTTLDGAGKKITNSIKKVFPNLFTLKLACLGSPCNETGTIGFHNCVSADKKPLLLAQIITAFEKHSIANGYTLFGIKDIPEKQKDLFDGATGHLKYGSVPGQPTAYLDIDFKSVDEYIARLSANTRKTMRRKLRASEGIVKIEYHQVLGENILPLIIELYNATRQRSEMQFEELTAGYFSGVVGNMQGRSHCAIYYVGDEIMAANLLVFDNEKLIDKFFCMKPQGREYDLYFISWFNNINYCLANGIKRYQSGQAGYENKIRLGSSLARNWMYFRHKNSIVHGALQLVSPMLAADDTLKQEAA